jgi:hypothetical protein
MRQEFSHHSTNSQLTQRISVAYFHYNITGINFQFLYNEKFFLIFFFTITESLVKNVAIVIFIVLLYDTWHSIFITKLLVTFSHAVFVAKV